MAKLTRSKLKSLVKECLVEILEEGISSSSSSHVMESKTPHTHKTNSFKSKKKHVLKNSSLDEVRYNNNYQESIDKRVAAVTSDPIMSSIFADTAATTLQEQINSEPRGRGQSMTSMAEAFDAPGGDISNVDLFSESSKNWAALAFPGK